MRKSQTVGFAVAEKDRVRLDRLAETLAGGNRSELLRMALDLVERFETAQEFAELQAYGQQRLEESGLTVEDIPRLVNEALADPDPVAVAEAKLIVAGVSDRRLVERGEGPPSSEAGALFRELASETSEP